MEIIIIPIVVISGIFSVLIGHLIVINIRKENEKYLSSTIKEHEKSKEMLQGGVKEYTKSFYKLEDVKEFCRQAWEEKNNDTKSFKDWWKEFEKNI